MELADYSNIVTEWLRSLDLVKYATAFLDNGYDDLETCKQIGPEDLTAIGVLDPCDRGELLTAVGRLKLEGGTAVYFTLQPSGTDPFIVNDDGDYMLPSTNGYSLRSEHGHSEENGVQSYTRGYRRGISVDAAWDHISRSGKSLNASPVRRIGSSQQHRRSSEGRLLLTGGDKTPDLLKKVSQALSSSSSSFESIDAQTGSSTPFLPMASNSDDEETSSRTLRGDVSHRLSNNNSPDATSMESEEAMLHNGATGRKKSTSQKVASTIRNLVSGKSKSNEKGGSKGDSVPEIKNAAELGLPQDELLDILNAVSCNIMTQDEAILEANERALRREKDKKNRITNSIKRNFGKKTERPSERRHKISSSEERLLPGTSASDTSSLQEEGTITPPDFEHSPPPEYSHKIYNDVFTTTPPQTPNNRVSLDSIVSLGSAEATPGSRRSSEVCSDIIREEQSHDDAFLQVLDLPPFKTNTLESNASSASYHSTSSYDSFGARHSASVQTQTAEGPPEHYIAIGRAVTEYTPNPFRGHLTLKEGDLVYVMESSSDKMTGEGYCNNKRGVFKYRHIRILTDEEVKDLEKDRNSKSPEAVLKLTSVKELLKRINCGGYYGRFKCLGVDTLGRFKNLSEESLDMLGVTDDMHRLKLLTARDIIKDPDKVQRLDPELEHEFFSDSPSRSQGDGDDSGVAEDMARLQVSPRDSGCYPHMDGAGNRESNLIGAEAVVNEQDMSNILLDNWGMGHILSKQEESVEKDIQNHNSNNSNVIGRLESCEEGHLLRMTLQGSSTHRPLGLIPCGYDGNFDRRFRPSSLKEVIYQSSGDITGVDLLKNHPVYEKRCSVHRYERPWADSSTEDFTLQEVWGTIPQHKVHLGAHSISVHENHRGQTLAPLPHYSPPTRILEDSYYFRSSSLEEPLFQTQVWASSSIRPSPPHPKTLNLSRKTKANIKRRKSRSVSPHKRAQHRHGTLSHTTVYSPSRIGLHKISKGGRLIPTTREKLIEKKLEKKLRHDGIDLRDEPYSDKMGFCGIPPALVQRYADEIQAKISEVAEVLEDIRVRSLLESRKISFKSDHLSRESEKIVFEGRGTSISDWLSSLGLPMYIQPFFAKGWDELHILVNMEEEDLQTCGVHDPKHLHRLCTALEQLRLTYSSNHS